MAKTLMIQGTASNVGKSVLVAGILRVLKQDGYKVAPFKSQNMALNSFITADGFEMGRAQAMQAEAAQIDCDVRMNPILLKPTSDKGSQVIVNGEVVDNMTAGEYYAVKDKFVVDIMNSFNSLSEEYDIIVIEGAGSPAEINLNKNDFVNMGMAYLAKAPVLIVGDIDRGGVFASLYGTVKLTEEKFQPLIKGTIINKFRGDITILESGLGMLEELTGHKMLGVVPYTNVKLDDEDSLSEKFTKENTPSLIDIAVIRTPRISNFTDFNALEYIEGVNLRYVDNARELDDTDLLILAGTKNTMADLRWIRENGFESKILKHAAKNKAIIGICGGYQMLGRTLEDPHSVEDGGQMRGLNLLDIDTVFTKEKTRNRSTDRLSTVDGIFSELSNEEYEGYEIHMGESNEEKNLINKGNTYGSYIHGIFDRENISNVIVKALLREKGLSDDSIKSYDIAAFKQEQYDILADVVRKSLDMDAIYKIIEDGVSIM